MMKIVVRPFAILMALALGLTMAAPVVAQDGVELVPFTSQTFGVQGVIPAGWSEAAPGVYVRGAGAGDLTSVIIQAAPGMTAEALTGVLLGQLGIDALPDSVGTLDTDGYAWTLYEIDVAQAGLSIKVDLALAENETGVTLVLLQTLEDDYEALHEAVFLPVVEALAPSGAESGEADDADDPDGSDEAEDQAATYVDPAGDFTVPIPTNWAAEQRGGYTFLYSPDELITVSIVVVETDDPEQALAEAWAIVDPDFEKTIEDTTEIPVSTLEKFLVYTYEIDDEEEFIVQAEVRVHEGRSYVAIFGADLTEAERRQSQIQIIDSGFDITAIEETDLSDATLAPMTDEFIAEFEAYVESAMERYQTPGVAVAVVHDGEIAYANGFGVRNPEGDPLTPETRMLIGSTTKTMTTLLMAQVVDEGVVDWDTPVVEILPSFAVANPDMTESLTLEHMVCACTGVPRRDLELIFNSDELSAEEMIESLSSFVFFTDFGEAFQYSNQMVAAGGYLATLAAGGEYGSLYEDYVNLLEERIFDPLGMDSTTFSFEEVLTSDNYAVPYGLFTDFTFQPLSFEVEEAFLRPITPAGAAWSTVLDMANYMIMQLNEGVAADGRRIVSAENLAHTWEPQVAMSAYDDYGLGWIVSDYEGVQLLSHAGDTIGFSSEFAFLPEHELGVVVLTNQRVSLLDSAILSRLLEMLFEEPYASDQTLQFSFEQMQEAYTELGDQIERTAEPDVAAAVVGSYTNDALGDVTISPNDDGVLVFDAGEFQSELWFITPDEEQAEDEETVSFLLYDPPINGSAVTFEPDEAGVYQMTLGGGLTEYTFERVE